MSEVDLSALTYAHAPTANTPTPTDLNVLENFALASDTWRGATPSPLMWMSRAWGLPMHGALSPYPGYVPAGPSPVMGHAPGTLQ